MNQESKAHTYLQHSVILSILLHIVPGALVTLGFYLLSPLLAQNNYPPLLAFLFAILLINLPVMWGIMLFEGRKRNGRFSLEGVVGYQKKLPWKRFLLVFIGAFVAAFVLILLASPITGFLTATLFSWLPQWVFVDEQSQYLTYSKNLLVATFIFQLGLTGLVLPWTEELYFRGYLLPRISRFGKWAPLLSGLLFGLYHSWQLFGFASVFLLGVVLAYVVWWQGDIRLSVGLHVIANALTRVAFLLAALAM